MEIGERLRKYIERVEHRTPGICKTLLSTIDVVIPNYIQTFSYQEHMTGLLMGEVQSGKTSQMFGIMAAAADVGFKLFLMLTTDNVYLQQQTYRRALADMEEDFNVCDETDVERFIHGGLRRPTLVILKKNYQVLDTWRDNLAASGYLTRCPLFIFDDEADSASLNTKVNQKKQSTINFNLDAIKKLANSSIYLQVTATPQSVILQAQSSGFRPAFVHYFPPGKGYLGGDFFYSEPRSFAVRTTTENELDDLLETDEITQGLEEALLSFLVSGAHILGTKSEQVCNFLVHPSALTDPHETIASKIGQYLEQLPKWLEDDSWKERLTKVWSDLQSTKPNLSDIDKIKEVIQQQAISVIVMNSNNAMARYDSGMNVIVGGNSLGRGVTFPVLQTVYYCRSAKRPQADTFWQHCRMFGYDRDPNLMRLHLPVSLLHLFTELNIANKALIEQICQTSGDNLALLYPTGINPTRKSVVDRELLNLVVGGTNYFPRSPREDNLEEIDSLLASYEDGEHTVTFAEVTQLLSYCESNDAGLWGTSAFADCLKAVSASNAPDKITLIIRRNRDIGKGTGTMLSPDDRLLSVRDTGRTVLTMYRVLGAATKGWLGSPFWMPNIKFPHDTNFYILNDN